MTVVRVTTLEFPMDGRAVWEALGRNPDGFDSYVAEFGWERVVKDDLLPYIGHIREAVKGQVIRKTPIHKTTKGEARA